MRMHTTGPRAVLRSKLQQPALAPQRQEQQPGSASGARDILPDWGSAAAAIRRATALSLG